MCTVCAEMFVGLNFCGFRGLPGHPQKLCILLLCTYVSVSTTYLQMYVQMYAQTCTCVVHIVCIIGVCVYLYL